MQSQNTAPEGAPQVERSDIPEAVGAPSNATSDQIHLIVHDRDPDQYCIGPG